MGTTASLAGSNTQHDGFRGWLHSVFVRVSISHHRDKVLTIRPVRYGCSGMHADMSPPEEVRVQARDVGRVSCFPAVFSDSAVAIFRMVCPCDTGLDQGVYFRLEEKLSGIQDRCLDRPGRGFRSLHGWNLRLQRGLRA